MNTGTVSAGAPRAGIALAAARVRYGPLEALHGVDLPAPAGHLTVLLGRNGAGRSTALLALAGALPLASGRVLWDGADVTRLPAHARARRGLCLIPDQRAVFASLSTAENLELAAPAGDRSAALDAYPALRALLGRRAGTLSGGEQRMLAVARGLLTPARVLLIDEPTLGMSPATAARTHALLGDLAHGRSGTGGPRAVVIAEQRLSPALRRAASLAYELRRGAVVFSGEPAELPPR
ncbi:ATP-binding cassette domain-containing protein [Streptomyces sp. H27-D2]|uniref:ATP-binding cassette domain-containing protein n=1 Tax=Streptomyces sp. H27-D2 TaxID=3046304 RepID=UPI002DB696AD|nr:ATP-binding cassette domain-containing protein [Streptomyces sp. H27-D2]MEC4020872.1 ATP-binding cassette domain-containing protein [Streptomyces sp. H27-D2]